MKNNKLKKKEKESSVAGIALTTLVIGGIYLSNTYSAYKRWKRAQKNIDDFRRTIIGKLSLTSTEYELYNGKRLLITIKREVTWYKNKTIIEFKSSDGITRIHKLKGSGRSLLFGDYLPDLAFKEFTAAGTVDFPNQPFAECQFLGVIVNNEGRMVKPCAINLCR